ncbi:hypothetical protein ACOME3_008191 [Neoechinorhynchus agilis]
MMPWVLGYLHERRQRKQKPVSTVEIVRARSTAKRNDGFVGFWLRGGIAAKKEASEVMKLLAFVGSTEKLGSISHPDRTKSNAVDKKNRVRNLCLQAKELKGFLFLNRMFNPRVKQRSIKPQCSRLLTCTE